MMNELQKTDTENTTLGIDFILVPYNIQHAGS